MPTGRFATTGAEPGTGPHNAVPLAAAQVAHGPPPPEPSDPSAVRPQPSPVESRSASFGRFPGVDAARAMAITGGLAPGSIPPPPPNMMSPAREIARIEQAAPPVITPGPVSAPNSAPSAPVAPSSVSAPLNPSDLDAFQHQLKPSILGLPSSVVVGLAVVAVFAVIVLALMLAR